MKKRIINYVFDAAARTIVLSDYESINLEGLLLITNVTDNIILYNFADATNHVTIVNNILTLGYDTTGMSNTDDIQIFYDDAVDYPLTNTELRESPIMVNLSPLFEQLLLAVRYPAYHDRAGNTARVSGSVTASIATNQDIRTVTGLTNIDSYQGRILAVGQNMAAWANVVRSRIS